MQQEICDTHGTLSISLQYLNIGKRFLKGELGSESRRDATTKALTDLHSFHKKKKLPSSMVAVACDTC